MPKETREEKKARMYAYLEATFEEPLPPMNITMHEVVFVDNPLTYDQVENLRRAGVEVMSSGPSHLTIDDVLKARSQMGIAASRAVFEAWNAESQLAPTDDEIDQLRPAGVSIEEYRGWQWRNAGPVPHTARVSMDVSHQMAVDEWQRALNSHRAIYIGGLKRNVDVSDQERSFLIQKGWNPNIFPQEEH